MMNKEDVQRLYEQYGSWVFQRARTLLRDEQTAWEVVQDVFIKVLQVGDQFRGESSPWTWLYRITTNHCLNIIRSRKTWKKTVENMEEGDWGLEQNTGGDQHEVLINRNSFVQLIQDEDETTQKILTAYFVESLTQEEIAEVLDISRKTIYKKMKKFMEKARRKL